MIQDSWVGNLLPVSSSFSLPFSLLFPHLLWLHQWPWLGWRDSPSVTRSLFSSLFSPTHFLVSFLSTVFNPKYRWLSFFIHSFISRRSITFVFPFDTFVPRISLHWICTVYSENLDPSNPEYYKGFGSYPFHFFFFPGISVDRLVWDSCM